MAGQHGKDAVFKITDAGAVLRDISAQLTSSGFDFNSDVAEISGLGSTDKSYVAGLNDATCALDGILDATTDGYLFGIRGLSKAFEYYPQGNSTGKPKYTGSGILTGYSPNTPIGDAGKFTAAFQVTGAVARALVP